LFEIIGDSENAELWKEKFETKKRIVNDYYWDRKDCFYYDIDCNSHDFYKVKTVASFWALTAGIAGKEQAGHLVEYILDPNTFGGEVPLVSLARNDNDYSPNGNYWHGSLWLPNAYSTLKGLSQYGFFEEAHTAGYKIFKHMLKTYENFEPHTIWECYSPEKCEPAVYETGKSYVRPDFCGWSALGPISIYIECVLGFHKIDAFTKTVEWEKPSSFKGKIGINNLKFGNILTDIEAVEDKCRVVSNDEYTLKINRKSYHIYSGVNEFVI